MFGIFFFLTPLSIVIFLMFLNPYLEVPKLFGSWLPEVSVNFSPCF